VIAGRGTGFVRLRLSVDLADVHLQMWRVRRDLQHLSRCLEERRLHVPPLQAPIFQGSHGAGVTGS
jgi:hypothetical protein